MPPAHAGPPLLDFSSAEVVRAFRVINDGVMGGVSTSRLSSAAGAMRFEGEVSLENNGGFASFRGPVRFPAESAALLLTVRGDGQRYKLTLKLDDSPGTAQYQAAFVAPREWQTLRFEPADFAASFRGRAVAAPMMLKQWPCRGPWSMCPAVRPIGFALARVVANFSQSLHGETPQKCSRTTTRAPTGKIRTGRNSLNLLHSTGKSSSDRHAANNQAR